MIAPRMPSMSPPVDRSITVSAPYLSATRELAQLALDVARHRAVADVRVHLASERDADAHRLEVRVVHVRRDDQPPAGDLVAYERGLACFSRVAT